MRYVGLSWRLLQPNLNFAGAFAEQSQPAAPIVIGRKKRVIRQKLRLNEENKWGYIFLAPWIIGFLLFTAIPMIASVGFSVTNYNLLKPDEVEFIGLENYRWLLNDTEV